MSNDDHDATLAISAGDIEKQLKAAQSDSTPAKLVCIDDSQLGDDQKGLEVELMADEVTVGRGEESELRISHKKISRHHARIYLVDGAWWLEDRGSTNGVFLNNEKIEIDSESMDYVGSSYNFLVEFSKKKLFMG